MLAPRKIELETELTRRLNEVCDCSRRITMEGEEEEALRSRDNEMDAGQREARTVTADL